MGVAGLEGEDLKRLRHGHDVCICVVVGISFEMAQRSELESGRGFYILGLGFSSTLNSCIEISVPYQEETALGSLLCCCVMRYDVGMSLTRTSR